MLDFKKITLEAFGTKNYPLAEKLCQDWLKEDPKESEAYHILGLIQAQQNQLLAAIDFFRQAIKIHPKHPIYHNNLGHAYSMIGDLKTAKQHLHEALKLHPNHATAYNHLGILSLKENHFKTAEDFLKKAIRTLPNFWEAHFNLANCFAKQDKMQEAIAHYHVVLKCIPTHKTAQLNLGLAYYELHEYTKASHYLAYALEKDNDNVHALYCLGSAYLETGKVNNALSVFAKVIQLNPEHAKAHHNLGILHLRENHLDQALDYFHKTLKLQPNNETAKHMYHALSGITPKTPTSREYIIKLFNQYAPYYNENMQNKLEYRVPQLLREALGKQLNHLKPIRNVLELGCGSGLCSVFFRDIAHYLVGVDVSSEMIDQAKQLGGYDHLCVSDIIQYFPGENSTFFDLIILADVLVYHGALERLFQRLAESLPMSGGVCFNIEYSEKPGYHLQKTGRFEHSFSYIEKIAQENHFSLLSNTTEVIRQSRNKPVAGNIIILKREA